MLAMNLSTEIWQARREWHDIFKVLNGKNLQPRIPSKAIIQNRRTDRVSQTNDLKELLTTKPALQKILKGLLKWKERPKVTKARKKKEKSSETMTKHILKWN